MTELKNDELKKSVEKKEEKISKLKPENVPVKFWNDANGEIRVDELLKSYLELEKKFSEVSKNKNDKNILELALETDVPAGEYQI